jgi:hypothetical protein
MTTAPRFTVARDDRRECHFAIEDLPNKLRTKVRMDPSGCWIWTAAIDRTRGGYGFLGVWISAEKRRTTIAAHRAVYQALVGPIADGLVLDHLCRNPPCVNPAHLDPVTQRVNLLRSPNTISTINATKTHCVRGHEFTPQNTRHPDGSETRRCRQCARDHATSWYQAARRLGVRLPFNANSREYCRHGHEMTEANSYSPPDGTNPRCRACRDIARAKSRSKRR